MSPQNSNIEWAGEYGKKFLWHSFRIRNIVHMRAADKEKIKLLAEEISQLAELARLWHEDQRLPTGEVLPPVHGPDGGKAI